MSRSGEINGPPPSRHEVSIRLARLEEKQDAQMEKLDIIARQLDGELSEISDEVDTMRPRHNRLWIVYQGAKWVVWGMLAGGVTIELFKFVY